MTKNEKLIAIMWLYLAEHDQVQQFTEFYKASQGKSLARIDHETKAAMLKIKG